MANTRHQIQVWTNNPTRKEALASGTIYPGMAVVRTSATADTVIASNVADVDIKPLLIGIEGELLGREISVPYTAGERVSMFVPYPGDEILALVAAGQNIAKGDYLTPDGNGYWKKVATTEAKVLQAREALDISATGAVADHILAEVC